MTLTSEAWDRFNQYLHDMRASLTGSAASDLAEIEQDIRDHVGAELAGRSSPVSADELDIVLRRLGSPRQWAGDIAPAAMSRSSAASFEDWLTYASAASMLPFLLFPPLLIFSWLLARWTIARLEERGEPLGARRWLLYPPIVIVIAPLATLVLLWAFAPFAEFGGAMFNRPTLRASRAGDVIGAVATTAGGLGTYWMALGGLIALADGFVRFLLYPFGNGFRRRHGGYLAIVGAALTVVSVATLIFIWNQPRALPLTSRFSP